MLKGDFYQINKLSHIDGTIETILQLNTTHAIFKGHFPGQPVVPGVCLLQIVKETLASALVRVTVLTKADYLKFIAPVVPNKEQELHLQLKYTHTDENEIKISATLKADTVACFKFQGTFKLD